MVNISTRYEKVFDKRKKVFMVRGDEAYAHTVDVDLTYSTPTTTSIKGFKTSLTATLYRHQGKSTVVFYDGEELIKDGNLATTQNTSTYTLSDIYLSYGVEHDLYAVYIPNQYTLRGKSKTVKATVEFPESLKTNIIIDNYEPTIDENGDQYIVASIKQGSTDVDDDTPVKVYLDNEYYSTEYVDDGEISTTIASIEKGEHTFTLEVESSETLMYADKSQKFYSGYNVEITEAPTYFITGQDNIVKVKVTELDGTLKSGAGVTLASVQKFTDDNGIATFNFTSPVAGTYTASTHGSSSQSITFTVIDPTTIGIERYGSDSLNVAYDNPYTIKIATPYPNADISVIKNDDSSSVGHLRLDENGEGYFTRTGQGKGETKYTAYYGEASNSLILYDYLTYWKSRGDNWNIGMTKGTKTSIDSMSDGLRIQFSSNSSFARIGVDDDPFASNEPKVIEFDLLKLTNAMGFKLYGAINILPSHVGKTIRIEYNGSSSVVKCGTDTLGTVTTSDYSYINKYVLFNGVQPVGTATVLIDNIKIYRGSDE